MSKEGAINPLLFGQQTNPEQQFPPCPQLLTSQKRLELQGGSGKIRIHIPHQGTVRPLEATAHGGPLPLVALVLDQHHLGLRIRRQIPDHSRGAIAGPVVHEDPLPAELDMGSDQVQHRPQPGALVVAWNDDA